MRRLALTLPGSGRAPRDVAAEGFHHGSQGIDPADALGEIDATFAGARERVRRARAAEIKAAEGRVETLARESAAAEGRWSELRAQRPEPPAVFLPLAAVVAALLAVAGEAILLAPVMDGLGIADPFWQYAAAVAFILVTGVFFGVVVRQFFHGEPWAQRGPRFRLLAAGVLAVGALALGFASVLGWWRAEELIFAGSQSGGALGRFLAENPNLTRALMPLATVSLPLAAAIAFDWGGARLAEALEWRRARRAQRRLPARLDAERKRQEALVERRDRELGEVEATREEWRRHYLEHHDLGREVGARRVPLWYVLLRVLAVAGLSLAAAFLLLEPALRDWVDSGAARAVVCAGAAACAAAFYAARALLRWDRPTARQLLAHRAVLWRGAGEPAPARRERALRPEPESALAPLRPAVPHPGGNGLASHMDGMTAPAVAGGEREI